MLPSRLPKTVITPPAQLSCIVSGVWNTADEYSYISDTATDRCMRCSDSFYRKSGNHLSNGTNMCNDIYMASIIFGDSSRYSEISKPKLTRIEMDPITVKVKETLIVASRA